MASWKTPRKASQPMSAALAWKGTAQGRVSTQEISAPTSTAGIRSTVARCARSTTRLAAEASGTPAAISIPSSPSFDTPSRTIHHTPPAASAIASQVARGTGVLSTSQPSTAASRGDRLITTTVLATLVRVSAIMKQVNITAHIAAEKRPQRPMRTTAPSAPDRHRQPSPTAMASRQKKLRQKVTSRLCASSSCRLTKPATDHMQAHTIRRPIA